MKELQMMIDNWKQEADELSAQVKGAAISFNMSIQLSSKAKRLMECITDAELLLNSQSNNNTLPQLHKHDVIGWQDFKDEKIKLGTELLVKNKKTGQKLIWKYGETGVVLIHINDYCWILPPA